MATTLQDIRRAARAAGARLLAWIAQPFASGYRWGIPLALLAGACLALPPVAGLLVFAPFAAAFALKAVRVSRIVHRLGFVTLVEGEDGRATLDTKHDRLQRAWVLLCVALVALSLALLAVRAAFAFVPDLGPSGPLSLYLAFAAVLVAGFLLCYYGALRLDSAFLRGLASITVTLPAFFVIVALVGALVSGGVQLVEALGLPAGTAIADGFAWVHDVQRVLGSATGSFVRQDVVVIGGSVVFAAVLLLLYAYTVPYYWIASVARWFRGLGLAAVVLTGAALVFAGVWVYDVQRWAAEGASSQLAHGISSDVLGDQAEALSSYRAEDLVGLVRTFVLPYTVGVFVANAVVAYRRAKAKRLADNILDGFALAGRIDEAALPEQEKRYLFFGGRRTLWDIALRSIGRDVPLPHPFAPRRLTWKERLTGELEDR